MNAEVLFRAALVVSIGAHLVGMAIHTSEASEAQQRVVKIPVVLESQPQVEPPPPPAPKPKKVKPRPRALPRRVAKVVQGDGLRAGELVQADIGDYGEELEAEPIALAPPPPPPPPPPPKPKPPPKIDKVKLTRQYLQKIRVLLAARKVYPLAAQRMGISGSVAVSFVIGAGGTFSGIQIRRSSGFTVLDNAALATVQGSSGQVPRPHPIGSSPLRTSVVLRYRINS